MKYRQEKFPKTKGTSIYVDVYSDELYQMLKHALKDGNKRASVIFANHYLIAQGMGFLVIPEKDVPEFKELLVKFYEGETIEVLRVFMRERCWKKL